VAELGIYGNPFRHHSGYVLEAGEMYYAKNTEANPINQWDAATGRELLRLPFEAIGISLHTQSLIRDQSLFSGD
jgi:hypothetical protein